MRDWSSVSFCNAAQLSVQRTLLERCAAPRARSLSTPTLPSDDHRSNDCPRTVSSRRSCTQSLRTHNPQIATHSSSDRLVRRLSRRRVMALKVLVTVPPELRTRAPSPDGFEPDPNRPRAGYQRGGRQLTSWGRGNGRGALSPSRSALSPPQTIQGTCGKRGGGGNRAH